MISFPQPLTQVTRLKTSSRRSTAAKPGRKQASPRKKTAPTRTANLDNAIHDYEEALKLFTRKEFSKAAHLFEAVIKEHPGEREVCDRARMYLSVIRSQSAGGGQKTKDQDLYYLGVIASNDGRLDDAAALFERVTRQDPRSDKAWYGLAAVAAQKGDRDAAVSSLRKALELNPSNRVHALNDPELDGLREDPEFMGLLGKQAERGA